MQEIEAWILEWLKRPGEFGVDCLSEEFHEGFSKRFGYKGRQTNWGAGTVRKAMEVLSKMAAEGKLVTRRISLGRNWQPGFPKSVISYSLE